MIKKRYKTLIAALLIIVSVVAVDYFVGYRQNTFLREKAALQKKLQRMAYYVLQSNIKDMTYSGERYKMTLSYEKAPFQKEDIYVMTPAIRVFVQVGTLWKEVPLHDVTAKSDAEVIRLDKPLVIEKLIEVPFKNYEEVLPGFMHVRINSVSYVASDTISTEDIAEKNEDFFIYLKPYYADDKAMANKFKFENNVIPVWIPMPPH